MLFVDNKPLQLSAEGIFTVIKDDEPQLYYHLKISGSYGQFRSDKLCIINFGDFIIGFSFYSIYLVVSDKDDNIQSKVVKLKAITLPHELESEFVENYQKVE